MSRFNNVVSSSLYVQMLNIYINIFGIKGGFMRPMCVLMFLSFFLSCAAAANTQQYSFSVQDKSSAFRAAGYTWVGSQWQKCTEHEGPGYTAGALTITGDLNGDARPEAIITEESSYCYGMAGVTFDLVSKQIDGSWRLMASGIGIPRFLTLKGVGGWPDIEIGGPGFCFPVERWNGTEYKNHRKQYDGKSCKD